MLRHADNLLRVLSISTLCNLQLQILRRNAIPASQFHQVVYQLGIIQIYPGNIHRHRFYIPALIQPLPQIAAGFLPDKLVHLVDKAVILKHRNKIPRGNKAVIPAVPAHQRLRSHNGFVLQPVLGLEIDGKFLVFYRPFHGVDNLLLLEHLQAHILIILAVRSLEFALRLPESHIGPVAHDADRQGLIINAVQAEAEHRAMIQGKAVRHHLHDGYHALGIPLARLVAHHKIVSIQTSADTERKVDFL